MVYKTSASDNGASSNLPAHQGFCYAHEFDPLPCTRHGKHTQAPGLPVDDKYATDPAAPKHRARGVHRRPGEINVFHEAAAIWKGRKAPQHRKTPLAEFARGGIITNPRPLELDNGCIIPIPAAQHVNAPSHTLPVLP